LGGEWACRRAANDERRQLKAASIMYVAVGVISALIYVAPNYHLAFGLMGLATFGNSAANGPMFATIQSLVPERLRATSIALIYLFANLVGMGLGPLAAGILSDALRPLLGQESVRYVLLILCPGYLLGGWHLWLASKTVTRDVGAMQADREREALGEHVVEVSN
jgi:MFS family permease